MLTTERSMGKLHGRAAYIHACMGKGNKRGRYMRIPIIYLNGFMRAKSQVMSSHQTDPTAIYSCNGNQPSQPASQLARPAKPSSQPSQTASPMHAAQPASPTSQPDSQGQPSQRLASQPAKPAMEPAMEPARSCPAQPRPASQPRPAAVRHGKTW